MTKTTLQASSTVWGLAPSYVGSARCITGYNSVPVPILVNGAPRPTVDTGTGTATQGARRWNSVMCGASPRIDSANEISELGAAANDPVAQCGPKLSNR